jgi:hypothetical protein
MGDLTPTVLTPTSPYLFDQSPDENAIPMKTDHASQPQARRDGQGHPDPLSQFHLQFIGLDMAEVYLSSFHTVLVHCLAMIPCSPLPRGHGSLIESKSRHDRLPRTAVASTNVTTSGIVRSR